MRPLKLQLQAFGPYAGTEIIDFTKLGNRNMFVISGKTGAGKTTIFDGISFAIFGKASGDDRNGPDLRSHFAEPNLLTEVSLEFQLREKTYFIWRTPMQERKKKSGEGSTTVGAKAELYEISNEGKVLLAANVRDVDDKIKQIIGLDASQFKQILMIPQGEFKKLLVSESKEKEVILQKLFHTQIYKKIEEKLKDDVSVIKKHEEQLQIEIKALHDDIEWRPDREDIEQIMALTDEQIIEFVKEDMAESNNEMELLQNEFKLKEAWEKEIQKRLFQGKEIKEKFAERQRLRAAKDKLQEKQVVIDLRKVELVESQKAKLLEKQEQSYLRIGNRMNDTKVQLEKLKQQYVNIRNHVKQSHQDYQLQLSKTEEREAAVANVISLQDLKSDVLSFANFQKEVELYEKQWRQHSENRLSYEKQVSDIEIGIAEIDQAVLQSQKASTQYSETIRNQEKNEEVLRLFQDYKTNKSNMKTLENQLLEKKKKITQAEIQLGDAKKELEEMERAIFQSHASLLASNLVDGLPCAVCGSVTHPNPAIHDENNTTQEAFEQQKEKANKAEQLFIKLQREYDKLQMQFENIQDNVNKQVTALEDKVSDFCVENIDDHIQYSIDLAKNLSINVAKLLDQKKALPDLEQKRVTYKDKHTSLLTSLKQEKEKEDSSKELYIKHQTKWLSMMERLPEQLRSYADYEKALKAAISKRDELQQLLESKQKIWQQYLQEETKVKSTIETYEENLSSLQVELERERDLFKQEMENQGFESYQSYVKAKKEDFEIEKLKNEIESFDKEYQHVSSLFTNIEYVLKDVEMPDIESLEQQVQNLIDEMNKQREIISEMHVKIQQNEKVIRKMTMAIDKRKEIQREYETIGHLYEISKGQNPFRITFERFVLAAFLDDILLEANERLTKMTSGRYRLLRKVDPTRRNIQSGLELTVFDQYTGTERHVKTLSGGESFKASLSLALGLAAVVQQNAGGISLETMFIDEGFGTLDPESLDQAIEALLDIQSNGRLVGIISHVPELKERIDARLEVMGQQNGSTTKFILT
ncbi:MULTISPECIES: AAA family ATPase [Bacillus]|uniref:AAA family ATPase n=1 Tax=Bacillus TaxID=1386 RepID=UPI0002DAE456|nr:MULTISPECIES: AAA family ATPase [Bacillus]